MCTHRIDLWDRFIEELLGLIPKDCVGDDTNSVDDDLQVFDLRDEAIKIRGFLFEIGFLQAALQDAEFACDAQDGTLGLVQRL